MPALLRLAGDHGSVDFSRFFGRHLRFKPVEVVGIGDQEVWVYEADRVWRAGAPYDEPQGRTLLGHRHVSQRHPPSMPLFYVPRAPLVND